MVEQELDALGNEHDGAQHRLTWMEDDRLGSVARKRYLKTLFTLSRCRIARIRVLNTDSPNRQCMQALGVESYGGGTTTERGKIEAQIDVFWNWPIGYLYRPI